MEEWTGVDQHDLETAKMIVERYEAMKKGKETYAAFYEWLTIGDGDMSNDEVDEYIEEMMNRIAELEITKSRLC